MTPSRILAAAVTLALSLAACSGKNTASANTTTERPGDARRSDVPSSGSPAAVATAPMSTSRIPFIVGLRTVSAVSDANGDYESFASIESIASDRYRIVVSAELKDESGGAPREISVPRWVRMEDVRSSRAMRHYFHTGDAEQFTGTTPGVSTAVMSDLRNTGASRMTFVDVDDVFGMSVVQRTLNGTIKRVEPQAVPVAMLVNDKPTQLPAIHVKGVLSDDDSSDDFEFYILDDPDNPLLLAKTGPGFSSSIIRIDYPEAGGTRQTLETKLAANEPVDVYGIYFSFNRADIRPESDSVLQVIADVMMKNPTWHLRIDGHTDAIGNNVANQILSEKRAAAVKSALVTRYKVDGSRLATGGHGASNPKDRNDTPEGRARNRRVELRRE
ncbi:MAG TPA: OmpA family protein [Gemmatimonadaceae bacterium]|nr:OmpA family protein [Gemmatimonadaceae bacterium]